MKKIVSIIVAAILLCGAVAFAQIDLTGMSIDELRTLQSQIALAIAEQTGSAVASKGTVLIDNEYCKVTLTGDMEITAWGLELGVIIENRGDITLSVYARQATVNAWTLNPMGPGEVNKKSNLKDTITIMGVEDADITKVEDVVEVRLVMGGSDADTWDSLFETDEITLTFAPAE